MTIRSSRRSEARAASMPRTSKTSTTLLDMVLLASTPSMQSTLRRLIPSVSRTHSVGVSNSPVSEMTFCGTTSAEVQQKTEGDAPAYA